MSLSPRKKRIISKIYWGIGKELQKVERNLRVLSETREIAGLELEDEKKQLNKNKG